MTVKQAVLNYSQQYKLSRYCQDKLESPLNSYNWTYYQALSQVILTISAKSIVKLIKSSLLRDKRGPVAQPG